jgi:MFS family permease
VRPFGALFFGRLGDLVGRKYTFLVTMTIMGLSTFIVGLLPGYATVGIISPVAFIACRLLQGLALGGEYGGAATYVAEHAPHGKRGFYTSWIQTTATFGLFLSLLVILGLRVSMSAADFAAWGWRIPFLVSIVLLGVSIWIRLKLAESPAFLKMKREGTHSKAPLAEAFGRWQNLKIGILALFGGTAGQAVIWYGGQFYALFFLTQTLKMDGTTANLVIAAALLIGTPGFVLFGWLSDKIGRKPIILGGCLLGAVFYFPLFEGLTSAVNPALEAALEKSPVTVIAYPGECSFQFNPTGTSSFTSSCDVAKSFLATNSVNYTNQEAPAGTVAQIKVGDTVVPAFDRAAAGATAAAKTAAFTKAATDAIRAAGYPAAANPAQTNLFMTILILFVLVIFVTMVYGPIAAMLVELFPTRIRYSGMSLPYHIGNGWFGGFLPPAAFAIVAATGNIYSGLWYPVSIAAGTFVIGLLFLPETKDVDIFAADTPEEPHERPASATI